MEEIHDQTQSHTASAESWLLEVKRRCDPQHYNLRQVSPKVCIYKVPKPLMDAKPEAYVTTVVSLGPYHHKTDPKFFAMDEHKFEAVHRTLRRLNGVTLDNLLAKIRDLEIDIRNFYEDSAVEWTGQMLSWMFVVDACFILEYFRSFVEVQTNDISSFSLIFNSKDNLVHFSILYDIIKLENQIPLFILTTLLELEFANSEQAASILATVLSGFHLFAGCPFSSGPWFDKNKNKVTLEKLIKKGALHLLDLSRRVFKELLTESGSHTETAAESDVSFSADDMIFNPRAELLHGAGIQFKSGDARFEKSIFGRSTLSLPQMDVDDSTEKVLRNLMAFEECQRRACSPEKTVISHYIRIMDDIIESERDVSILKKAKIIRNYMGSNEAVADMFNHLCKDITFDEDEKFEFELVVKQARLHFSSQWKVWVNEFKEDHCSKPWYIVPIVAALLILAMTAVQTFYSVKKSN